MVQKVGILFKGGVHLENISEMKAIALDKTGTLTQGKPVVTDFLFDQDLDRIATLTKLATIEGTIESSSGSGNYSLCKI